MHLPRRVAEFAAALPTEQLPAYVVDLADLRRHVRRIRADLPETVELYYAAKANPDERILATLAGIVDGFEVSSGGELAHVAAHGDGPLAFGGPGKTEAELASALEHGVRRIHVESVHELHRLAHLTAGGPGVDVLLRLNLPAPAAAPQAAGLVMGGRTSPFGLDPDEADRALHLAAAGTWPSLRITGVHTHLASGLDADGAAVVARHVVDHTRALAGRHDLTLTEVVLGGGMTVDYARPDDRFDWASYGVALRQLAAQAPDLTLRLEPGRALTAYCGWYVTDVLDAKTAHGRPVSVVRGGTHHLRTPATKGHDQPAAVLPVEEWPHPWPRPAVGSTGDRVIVSGQLCTPKDVLSGLVPAPLRAGDRLAFGLVGAYAWNISHHEFLMHPHPSFHHLE